ncbi:MAG TPA: hypothetical protein VKU79_02575 [Thermoplasmataceae archaeon]|nr:hypothetical protein [Thermoplasmatales archaeon AK]HLH85731.1 hypothetical protein [Thermoplasmataceae archaeon]
MPSSSNLKGWVGFLVVVIILFGLAFGTNAVLHLKSPGASVTGISADLSGGAFNASNVTYSASLPSGVSSIHVTVNFSTSVSSGTANATIISGAYFNQSEFNLLYPTINATLFREYSSNFNASYNASHKSGGNLSAAYSANRTSIEQNATINATLYADENSTFQLFPEAYANVTYKGTTGSLSVDLALNTTVVDMIPKGTAIDIIITIYTGPYGANGFILLTKS